MTESAIVSSDTSNQIIIWYTRLKISKFILEALKLRPFTERYIDKVTACGWLDCSVQVKSQPPFVPFQARELCLIDENDTYQLLLRVLWQESQLWFARVERGASSHDCKDWTWTGEPLKKLPWNISINQSINQTSIVPISPAKPGSVVLASQLQIRLQDRFDRISQNPESKFARNNVLRGQNRCKITEHAAILFSSTVVTHTNHNYIRS